MPTASEKFSKHPVWETVELKKEALKAARYDNSEAEKWREEIIGWLEEASKTKPTRQPTLYLRALDDLSQELNRLPVDSQQFTQYANEYNYQSKREIKNLETAIKGLPLPPPRDLKASYVDLLDREAEVRNSLLNDLEEKIREHRKFISELEQEVIKLESRAKSAQKTLELSSDQIQQISENAESTIRDEWNKSLDSWNKARAEEELLTKSKAVEYIGTLAATTKAGEALAEHAAGDLSASDWYGRATRERRAALWIRAAALTAFILAGAVGAFIVFEAIQKDFAISVGGGILRSAITFVIGAFGALLLREAGRHFRESDTAEDVALSMKALAPFYANSDSGIRTAARVQLGDAVLVQNVLSRFSHRDAAKHGSEVNMTELPDLVKEATKALKLDENAQK